MNKVFLLASALVATTFITADTFAQRDAGAKARGEVGKGFWHSDAQRLQTPTSAGLRIINSQQTASSGTAEGYRSFSYEPSQIQAGDSVVVRREGAKMMRGDNVIGEAPADLKFTVTRTVDGWLGAVIEVNGQELRGWIRNENVALETDGDATPQSAASADLDQSSGYRRFSYEPSVQPMQRRNVRSRAIEREPAPPYVRQHPGSRSY